MRYLLSAALAAGLALPAAAQPRPDPGSQPADPQAEIARLREIIKALQNQLGALQGGDRKRPGEAKPDPDKRPPRVERGPDAKVPGFEKLTPEEQAMYRQLVAKMSGRGQSEARRPGAPKPSGDQPSVEERLDRLEKLVQELVRSRGGSR
jgi:hypothetical protein